MDGVSRDVSGSLTLAKSYLQWLDKVFTFGAKHCREKVLSVEEKSCAVG